MVDYTRARRRMVRRQLARRGIQDRRVLQRMEQVPRELFVSHELSHLAYDDSALPIEFGQTISQPYVVALMTEALKLRPGDRALEVGTGSGYGAAVLSGVCREVHTVERHPDLAHNARQRLRRLGCENVTVHTGDGSGGLPEEAPFDAVSVTADAPRVPEPLLDQLAPDGRLVIPVGPAEGLQTLIRVQRTDSGLTRDSLGEVRFVPLVGERGWNRAQ